MGLRGCPVQLLGFVGVLALGLASLAVGARLLVLARRTGGRPELFVGVSYLASGFLACPLTLAAAELTRSGSPAAVAVQAANDVAQHAGNAFLVLFVWQVFRAGTALGRVLGVGALVGLAASLAASLASARLDATPTAADTLAVAWRAGIYAWGCIESLREHAAARRRVRLGLADPLVANRLLLWGLGTGFVLLLWVDQLWRLASGSGTGAGSYPVIAVLGLACALTSWLAFFPPAAWRRRFAARTPPG